MIKKWALFQKKIQTAGGEGRGGGVRIWNFQGYQTNRMWNFQELIKNDMECNLFQMVETKKK